MRSASPTSATPAVLAVEPHIDDDEQHEHAAGDERRRQPQMLRRPEEIDAVEEADEQRRIAERRQRAADIADEKDEEHHDMDVVRRAALARSSGRIRIMAAPVVPTTLAISVPKASMIALTSGVPRNVPATKIPPATT